VKFAPKQFNAVYGAACGAQSAGNESAANLYFRKLAEFAVGSERPELLEARKHDGK